MWIGLTGSPSIGGVVYDGQLAVEGRLVPEHELWQGRGGLEVVLDAVLRPEGEIRYNANDSALHYQLMRATAIEFDLALRTERPGDAGPGDARVVRVRRVSDIELTTPNSRRRASTGELAWTARIAWRAVRPETADVWLPPVLPNGFAFPLTDADGAGLQDSSGATLSESPS